MSQASTHSQGPSGWLKTSGFGLGFQHFPRDLANVNGWKKMFAPFITAALDVTPHVVLVGYINIDFLLFTNLQLRDCLT